MAESPVEGETAAGTGAGTPIRRRPISRSAVLSLLAGVIWVGGIASLVAITFGIIGLAEIRGGRRRGEWLARLGMVLGVVGLTAGLIIALVAWDESGSEPPSSERAPASSEPATSTTVASGPIGASQSFACQGDLEGLRTAVGTFQALRDRSPSSVAELIAAGALSNAPTWYTLGAPSASGEVTIDLTAAGLTAGCAAP